MKKLMIMVISALAALAVCAAAFANNTAVELYSKTAELLFDTDSVTLKAHAEFSLDGSWFKTADSEWRQDGNRSFRQLLLSSPRADGTERRNGYTIVTEGYDLYLMEVFTPGFFRKGFTGERTSLLRSSAETKQLVRLGSALASQADLFLGAGALTKAEDGTFRLSLGDNTPEMANAVLDQLARFVGERYYGIDYDKIRINSGLSFATYPTLTGGILYTMQGVSLRMADITLKTDENGNLLRAEGSIGLYLETASDGIRQLDVSFRAEVSDRGSTVVKRFSPDDYNVVLMAPDEAEPLTEFGMEAERNYPLISEEPWR